ncbi:MAG: hypothetical protein CMF62_01780 [Magnetococcales bacterium]|nr:hypothetical protein [Magnetococcales bacterium]
MNLVAKDSMFNTYIMDYYKNKSSINNFLMKNCNYVTIETKIIKSQINCNTINIPNLGDLIKILNFATDYKPNLKIKGIRFLYKENTLIDIPYDFIETFFEDYIKIIKNKLIIDFSFLYNLLEFPKILFGSNDLHVVIYGNNIHKFQLLMEYTNLKISNINNLNVLRFIKPMNYISHNKFKIENDSYVLNMKEKTYQTIGVFIKNINIDDIDSIKIKLNGHEFSICEDFTTVLTKCKKYKNGIYISFGNKNDDFELSQNYINIERIDSSNLIIKMDKIPLNVIPEAFFICPDFMEFTYHNIISPFIRIKDCEYENCDEIKIPKKKIQFKISI